MKKTIYVALLRGINVGGKNKVDMKTLKKSFERVGLKEITTYINSGNIVFSSTISDKNKIEQTLEKVIEKDFKLKIKVLVRNLSEFEKIMKKLPKTWQNDKDMKSDVLFLWEEIDDKNIIKELIIKKGIDEIIYVSGTLLWKNNRKLLTKSGKMRLVASSLYKKMTIRNVNTTRKIYDLMIGIKNN